MATLVDDYNVSFCFTPWSTVCFFIHFRFPQNFLERAEEQGNTSEWYRHTSPLYDAFDPVFIKRALDEYPMLGKLIFGTTEWSRLNTTLSDTNASDSDPLTDYFAGQGTFFHYNHSNAHELIFIQ